MSIMNFWPAILAGIYAIIRVCGIVAAGHAILNVRSSPSAIAWALSLALFPVVGLPLYLLVGTRKFNGYVNARRRGQKDIQQVAKNLAQAMPPFMLQKSEIPVDLQVHQQLAKLPFTKNNHIELLINGQDTYASMLAGLDEAQTYILFQFFIIENNETGHKFKEKLIERAKAGVAVYLIIDPLGSSDMSADFYEELKQAGIAVEAFNEPSWRNRFLLNFRNHRKIIVVDGKKAWVGGLNIGDTYLGKGGKFRYWRDTHLQVQGPLVQTIQLTFLEDWNWASKKVPELNWKPEAAGEHDQMAIAMPTGPNDPLHTCELFFLQLIHQAKSRIWLASPYFVPNDAVLTALQLAAIRGVDVRIMVPLKPDHFLVYLSGFTFLNEAEKTGVKIYRYQPGFLHQKVMLVDDEISVVGTANLDNRSLRINFEISILVLDKDFASRLSPILEADFNQCRLVSGNELAEKPLWFRLAARIARLLSPLQ